jgi:CelD/BcsL family acetyltransferase involved in cellulose biosynthesis
MARKSPLFSNSSSPTPFSEARTRPKRPHDFDGPLLQFRWPCSPRYTLFMDVVRPESDRLNPSKLSFRKLSNPRIFQHRLSLASDEDRQLLQASPELMEGLPTSEHDAPWEFLSSPHDWSAAELRRDWQRLIEQRSHVKMVYQTPGWFDHVMSQHSQAQITMAVTRDRSGRVSGIAPIRVSRESLNLHVAGVTLGRIFMCQAHFVGGLPLLPHGRLALENLVAAIFSKHPQVDGIGLSCSEVGSSLWHHLHSSKALRDSYLLLVVEGIHPYHLLPLPRTFDEYLNQYSAKKRYNLKRQIRILREHGGGRLELLRIDSPARAQDLVDAKAQMTPSPGRFLGLVASQPVETWSHHKVADLAERGFLRSYVLFCGEEPVSLIEGVQHEKTYFARQTLYRPDYAPFSPGACLLYLLVEDLLTHRPVEVIEFGFGEPSPRHHVSNLSLEVGTVLLLRKTLANRIRGGAHAAFFAAVKLGKRIRYQIQRGRQVL